jgi:dimethylsulfone monooxygenase
VQERIAAFEAAGVELMLLQFSPQMEEMEAFSEAIMSKTRGASLKAAR